MVDLHYTMVIFDSSKEGRSWFVKLIFQENFPTCKFLLVFLSSSLLISPSFDRNGFYLV